MKVTPDTLTDEMIREEILNHTDLVIRALDNAAWMTAARRKARVQLCNIINARNQDRCPGRLHRRHAFVICTGSCCTSCGGPIDEDSECRCDIIAHGAKP